MSTLIQGGTAVGGSGKVPYWVDICVADGQTVAIGADLSGDSDRVVDAS
jgi:hypothetical protein